MRVTFDLDGTPDEFRELLSSKEQHKHCVILPHLEFTELLMSLHMHTAKLARVLRNNNVGDLNMSPKQNLAQANPGLEQLRAQVEAANGTINSAITFINGIPTLIQTAVNQAMSNGATAQELQPVVDLGTILQTNADTLAQAIANNNPQPQPQPQPQPGP